MASTKTNRNNQNRKPSATAKRAEKNNKKEKNVKNSRSGKAKNNATKATLKLIPLGGLNEIGKNMTLYEYGDDMFIVDCGMTFPNSEMPGVDMVIPDFTYAVKIKDRIKGIILTHGHEDHIGGLPYFLKNANIPVYGTKLTLALVNLKLKEHG